MQPQAKKHVTMDCDGGRRGGGERKGGVTGGYL